MTSKQHNEEAHRSFQVNSEKISHDTSRPKGGPTVDLRMSDADMNDLRFEALTNKINKVESYLEKIVHHITINDSRHATVSPSKKRRVETTTETRVRSRPTPTVGCAESYIQIEDPNDDTVSVMAHEDFSDQEEQNISYEIKDYTQHHFDPDPNLKREFTPHEAVQKFVSRHFTTSLSSHGRHYTGGVWHSLYQGFRGSEGEPTNP